MTARPARHPDPQSAAETSIWNDMPAPVILLDAAGEITIANGLARALFAPMNPVGIGLRTLFSLAGASGGGDLVAALESGSSQPVRLGLADGSVLECRAGRLAGGGAILTLSDVSSYLADAERASRDALTGLANRVTLHSRLRDLLARPLTADGSLAIIGIDLDRFKLVNDSLGHPLGDALLIKVAERLRNAVGKDDLVARLGGDEFAIIQCGLDQPQSAETLATRLVDLIGRTYVIDGHMVNIGASVGIVIAPEDGTEAQSLIKRADLALYRAKAEGRGTFRFFKPEMDARMQARRAMEIQLRRALALKELDLVYQPQIQLETDAICGFEALLRWTSPTRGTVSPAEFIPLAEEIGLIVPIGEWVLRRACREAASWPDHIAIAVNLSPMQFRSATLFETVLAALTSSGLDPSRLELEITEGALLHDTEIVLSALHRLRTIGVRISMDDFGTGYSSLSYLQKFPFDKIKIDQSFVRGMGDNAECRAIVRAVAKLGESLGMKTTAEGVETAEQLAHIRAEGCTEVQGYLTGRPLSREAALALLAAPRIPNPIP